MTKSEKAELSRRLIISKGAAKKAIEANPGKYATPTLPLYVSSLMSPIFRSSDNLNTSFNSLKKKSDESAICIALVRLAMAELETERNGATDCSSLESAFFSFLYPSLYPLVLQRSCLFVDVDLIGVETSERTSSRIREEYNHYPTLCLRFSTFQTQLF